MIINFKDAESDFYQFMIYQGNQKSRTKTNYLSWLRFLSNNYAIDNTLTSEKIDFIITQELEKRKNRGKYKREKDISNFRSALRKYLLFIDTDFENEKEILITRKITDILNNKTLSSTEKKSIVLSRLGQGFFRKALINYWNSCSLNDYKRFDLLVASHIKPWKDANNHERLDIYNGLLLPPNYDKLFDKGYISFDRNGKIIISKFFKEDDIRVFNITKREKLIRIEKIHTKYLEYHNDLILIK
jgi:putative restriction endonuclease